MQQHTEMDELSEQMWKFHLGATQSKANLMKKIQLRNELDMIISELYPMSGLYVVGSSLNGFGTNTSDMDLCLMTSHCNVNQHVDAVEILYSVAEHIRKFESFVPEHGVKVILAKVPILRIEFHPPYEKIIVDININNSVAIKNTHLLCHYAAFDWRVRPLVSVVKEWAKSKGMNNANRSTFTSYSLVLMVIHYLQCGRTKPVMPSLQQLYGSAKPSGGKESCNGTEKEEDEPGKMEDLQIDWTQFDQSSSLGELLLGFMWYYSSMDNKECFNFDGEAISVRLGQRKPREFVVRNKSPYNHLSQWRCICIEEPFTLTNTALSVYDEGIFEEIKAAFQSGYKELKENRNLDSLFNMPPIPTSYSSRDLQEMNH